MNKAVELLPCPFCGKQPYSLQQGIYDEFPNFHEIESEPFWAIGCCDAHVAKNTQKEAIKAWNTRTTPSLEAIIAKIDALKIPHKAKNRTVEEADRFLITNQTIDKSISIIREEWGI